jgi:hypothetical protein
LLLGAWRWRLDGGDRRRYAQPGGLLARWAPSANYDCHAQTSFAFIHPVRRIHTLLKFDSEKYPSIKGDRRVDFVFKALPYLPRKGEVP